MKKTVALLALPFICLLLKAHVVPPREADHVPQESVPPGIYVDGAFLGPCIDETAELIPLRAVAEALGACVTWEPETESVTVETEGLILTATVGEKFLVANGRYLYLPEGLELREDRCVLPAETLARAFGAELTIDSSGSVLSFTGGGEPIASGEEFYDENDLYWLSRIICAEARGEPLAGKIAVGNVVLNRVAEGAFPDTVREVIFDRRFGVQFSPAYSGSIYMEPTEECVIAAKLALDGADTAGESLYFAAARVADTCWAGRNRPVSCEIGGHVFFA